MFQRMLLSSYSGHIQCSQARGCFTPNIQNGTYAKDPLVEMLACRALVQEMALAHAFFVGEHLFDKSLDSSLKEVTECNLALPKMKAKPLLQR